MTREEFYKLTDILNSEVLGNFMHGGEADELLAMFEEAVDHSNFLEQEEPVSDDLEEAAKNHAAERYRTTRDRELAEKCKWSFKAGAQWGKNQAMAEIQAQSMALAHGCPKEEPISEDIEAFIKERVKNIPIVLRSGFHELCRQLIRDGAEWKKEQMMAKAINTEASLTLSVPSICISLPLGVNVGDKVKVIVIKED